ncbi:hypothetical protein [Rubellimicrobium roseum]|uniref:PepSY domain-containing protein n=1 Tax=Rubellimicrobium roseum TaxID=687525 RepID=A0A5C4NE61_9RHOB|nr:hypothetical protein [Rubellimicrobium roseum]TNC73031.1 hypothetical protein FHG71_06970 [Rubellimicrobium roseum]
MIRMTTTALALGLAAGAAQAQDHRCFEHEQMARHLAENWGESRQSIALDAANSMVELYASPETGTWTLTVTTPDGPTCMIASGHAFELTSETLPVLDEGA